MSFLYGNFRSVFKEINSIIRYKHIRLRNFYYDMPRAFYHYFRDFFSREKVDFESK